MGSPVIIKGNKYGFVLVLDEQLDFILLRREIAAKFRESNRFFNASSQVTIQFEGRKLSSEEKGLVLETIRETTNLNISYIVEKEKKQETYLSTQIKETKKEIQKIPSLELPTGKNHFYRGNLTAGQSIEVKGNITLLGDIKKGASVSARGNILVIGQVQGMVFAGYPNHSQCFVMALNLNPTQLRIGKIYLYEKKKKIPKKAQIDDNQIKPQFAFIEKGSIRMELLEKTCRYNV